MKNSHLSGLLRMLRLKAVAHVVLLLLVAREDADLAEAAVEEPPEHGVTETTLFEIFNHILYVLIAQPGMEFYR